MSMERVNKAWKQVEHVGDVEHLDNDAMMALGSAFGSLKKIIKQQSEQIEEKQKTLNEVTELYGKALEREEQKDQRIEELTDALDEIMFSEQFTESRSYNIAKQALNK